MNPKNILNWLSEQPIRAVEVMVWHPKVVPESKLVVMTANHEKDGERVLEACEELLAVLEIEISEEKKSILKKMGRVMSQTRKANEQFWYYVALKIDFWELRENAEDALERIGITSKDARILSLKVFTLDR